MEVDSSRGAPLADPFPGLQPLLGCTTTTSHLACPPSKTKLPIMPCIKFKSNGFYLQKVYEGSSGRMASSNASSVIPPQAVQRTALLTIKHPQAGEAFDSQLFLIHTSCVLCPALCLLLLDPGLKKGLLFGTSILADKEKKTNQAMALKTPAKMWPLLMSLEPKQVTWSRAHQQGYLNF